MICSIMVEYACADLVGLERQIIMLIKSKSLDAQIGERIRKLRIGRGLSRAELGDMLNLSRSAISAYECGSRSVTASLLIDLCEVFGTDADTFLGVDEPKDQYIAFLRELQGRIEEWIKANR